MMPADTYAKQRKAREKGRNGGTKERENPNDEATRLAHVRCDYDVRTGRLSHPACALGGRRQRIWVLSRLDIELFIPNLFIWGIVDLVIGSIAVYAGVSLLRGGTFGFMAGYIFASL